MVSKFETNIISSFRNVRKEILELKSQFLSLAESQEKLEMMIDDLKGKKSSRKK